MSAIHPLKVVHVESLADHIIQLLLKPDFPIRYAAGDYIMLGFDREDLKPFSIASAPREDGLIECHIRIQSETDWMQRLAAVRVGDQLIMEDPKSQIMLQPAHQPIILVAGGTGFAPMKAILETLVKEHVAVPIHLYWGANSVEELYMHKEMLALTHMHGNIEYIPVISNTDASWDGLKGYVHEQVLKQHPSLKHVTAYICGPWEMVQKAKSDFTEAGLEPSACIF
ncbi:MAG: NAD(P)H-flavin reductase [Thiomicrorhabdus sp.]|nr:MAG: NAD(P)H-flavin reductase [Thiomicrorhabdus sp.]